MRLPTFLVLLLVTAGGLVASPAGADGLAPEVRASIDRQLFTGTVGMPAKVFKHTQLIKVRVLDAGTLKPEEAAKAQSTLGLVASAYHQLLTGDVIRSFGKDDDPAEVNFAVFFVNGTCDIACRNEIAGRVKGRLSLLLESKDDGGWPVCIAKAPVDKDTGAILGAVSVVDVAVPEVELTWCLLQAINTMLSRTDNLADIAFMGSYKRVATDPLGVAKAYFAQPGKALGLRLLYNPAVKPGMSRADFWAVAEKLLGVRR